ncbi:MAG TPA: hypothetical protein DEQ50_05315 [Lactobacillus sp.]|uniref:Uncharacterized protein n=1 Tax=Companilactobacillus nuruki TaxID=1993540 RepID=A0A2N7AU00_9LACO|nr:hypothetical protein [Companilactobacillus nuruki]PMD70273.1 hypothetical protein CBP76_07210 [Companilactobacillus nuruki]HCD07673.1 hypothetical protein [Lactobacillus sp.]
MSKRVTVRIRKSTGINFETLKLDSISGVYTSSSLTEKRYFIVYTNIFGSQALETTKSDYKLLTGVMNVTELDI